jgi:hypothetical protein
MAKEKRDVFKIPDEIKAAIERYYANRDAQSVTPWNKGADLDHIDAVATSLNIAWSAIAGTFWLSIPYYTYIVLVEVTPKNIIYNGSLQEIRDIKEKKPGKPEPKFEEVKKVSRFDGIYDD